MSESVNLATQTNTRADRTAIFRVAGIRVSSSIQRSPRPISRASRSSGSNSKDGLESLRGLPMRLVGLNTPKSWVVAMAKDPPTSVGGRFESPPIFYGYCVCIVIPLELRFWLIGLEDMQPR